MGMKAAKKRAKAKARAGGIPAAKGGISSSNGGQVASSESGEVVKFEENGMPQLDVWLEDETIWLTQKQMGLLFGCAPQNITYHIREIFKIGELDEPSTCKEFLQVQIEGDRRISRMQKFYNLDM